MMATAGVKRKATARPRRHWLRRAVIAVLIVLALPFGLTVLYRFVDPVSTLMIADRLTGTAVSHRAVPLDAVAPDLVYAVVMSEDGRYCEHGGVDWNAVKAAWNDDSGRGASTIAMQTVKNLFLWPSRSYLRKAAEVPLAYWADLVLGKRRLMEIYLNVAEWGVYGAEAAARHYFGRSARDLSDFQAALLTAALPNPYLRDPASPGPHLTAVANVVADRARAAGAYVGCLDL